MECSKLFNNRLKLIVILFWFLFILLNLVIYCIQANFNQFNRQLPHFAGTNNKTSKHHSNNRTIELPPEKLEKFVH